jgi:hypothetical protein
MAGPHILFSVVADQGHDDDTPLDEVVFDITHDSARGLRILKHLARPELVYVRGLPPLVGAATYRILPRGWDDDDRGQTRFRFCQDFLAAQDPLIAMTELTLAIHSEAACLRVAEYEEMRASELGRAERDGLAAEVAALKAELGDALTREELIKECGRLREARDHYIRKSNASKEPPEV